MQSFIKTLMLPGEYQSLLFEYRCGLVGRLAASTRSVYAGEVVGFLLYLSELGVIEVKEVQAKHIKSYLVGLERKGHKAVTRQRKLSMLRSFFAWLHQQGRISSDPTAWVIPPRWERKRPRVLTVGEYTQLLTVIDNVRDRAIVELMLQTGLRLIEVHALNMADIFIPDPVNEKSFGTAQVLSRSTDDNPVYLNSKACQVLTTWIKERPQVSTDALFVSRNSERLSRRQIQRVMEKHVQEAGLEPATVQALRHSFAAHHILKGTPINQVKGILGHRWVRSTEVYIEAARSLGIQYVQENGF